MDLSVAEVADETLAACIEERLRILRLSPSLKNLLMVEDDRAVSGWEVVAFFLFVARGFIP